MKGLLLVVPLLMLVVACSTKKQIIEVPVPVEKVKTEYIRDTRIDSIFVKDSIDRYMIGDTCYIYKEHIKYQYLFKTDTIVKVDSIPTIVTLKETTEVEVNRLKWYQSALMWMGGIVLITLVIYLTFKIKALWK